MTDTESHTFEFIEDDDALAEFAEREIPNIEGQPIGLDIEEDREHRYKPSVALIQITIADRDFVIDPLALSAPVFLPVIEALCLMPSRVIMHGCRNDVTGLKRDFGVGPKNVGDTQTAARFLGADAFGLAALLGQRFGVELNKAVRRSNWLNRPLSEKQIAYAREDTRYVLNLWSLLEAEVAAAGWADALEEECGALAELYPEPPVFDPLGWRRAKGAKQLTDVQQFRAAALWRWRDQVARSQNLHQSRTLAPWAVVYLAKAGAAAVEAGTSKGLPSRLTGPQRAALIRALDDPSEVELKRPHAPRKKATVSSDILDARMSRLSEWRARISERTGLESGFVAPRTVLESIARASVEGPEGYAEIPEIRQWRASRWADDWWTLR
ncbi:MAG: ribonuclease D [Bradymonadia bacterium]